MQSVQYVLAIMSSEYISVRTRNLYHCFVTGVFFMSAQNFIIHFFFTVHAGGLGKSFNQLGLVCRQKSSVSSATYSEPWFSFQFLSSALRPGRKGGSLWNSHTLFVMHTRECIQSVTCFVGFRWSLLGKKIHRSIFCFLLERSRQLQQKACVLLQGLT